MAYGHTYLHLSSITCVYMCMIYDICTYFATSTSIHSGGGLGLGTFGLRDLVSSFPSFPHHKFEANFPSLLLVILIYTFTLTLNSTNTGVSRHHPLNVIYLRRDVRPGRPTPAPPARGRSGRDPAFPPLLII